MNSWARPRDLDSSTDGRSGTRSMRGFILTSCGPECRRFRLHGTGWVGRKAAAQGIALNAILGLLVLFLLGAVIGLLYSSLQSLNPNSYIKTPGSAPAAASGSSDST